jgi:hypothetical protein
VRRKEKETSHFEPIIRVVLDLRRRGARVLATGDRQDFGIEEGVRTLLANVPTFLKAPLLRLFLTLAKEETGQCSYRDEQGSLGCVIGHIINVPKSNEAKCAV